MDFEFGLHELCVQIFSSFRISYIICIQFKEEIKSLSMRLLKKIGVQIEEVDEDGKPLVDKAFLIKESFDAYKTLDRVSQNVLERKR